MPPLTVALLLLAAAYIIGAIPFGYIVGRLRGVNLLAVGSGNIGATNAARVLGTPFGVLVFVLDFLKGAVPVAAILPLIKALAPDGEAVFGSPDVLRVGAAALTFVGHLFPVFLGFRGGKGVATGAGTIFVLVPGPAALAVLFWAVVLLASRTVSAASLVAALVLVLARLLAAPGCFGEEALPITLYLLIGSAAVVVKHQGNVWRLFRGTESPSLADGPRRLAWLRTVHVVALGMWFGGSFFFNLLAAPAIFASFAEAVESAPTGRTANEPLLPPDADPDRKKRLASALAGAAVGPVFPRYFAMQAVCGGLALVTASAWRGVPGGVHRLRVKLLLAGLLTVAAGWPLSRYVTELRVQRVDLTNPSRAEDARSLFVPWHLASLGLSFFTIILSGGALALAGRLPDEQPAARE